MKRTIYVSLLAVLTLPMSAHAITITMEPDRDTTVHQAASSTNSGGQASLSVGRSGSNFIRTLYHFDVSSLSGQYGSIDSMTLRLFVSANQISDAGSDPGLDIYIHEIAAGNVDWNEGNKSFATATAGEPTWNNRMHPSTSWAGSAGLSTGTTDYNTTARAFTNVTSGTAVGAPVDFTFTGDLTSLIDSWQTLNPGIILFGDTPTSGDRVFFNSREVANSALHPILTITYSPVPEPASGAMLLIGGGAFLGVVRARRVSKRSNPPRRLVGQASGG